MRYLKESQERKSEWRLLRAWGARRRVSIWEEEEALGIDSSDI
jgi:hypothetical protein